MDQHPTRAPISLPQNIPLFPLRGVLLLPGAELPLNIFEPRYIAMLNDALAHDRIIGMIQPKDHITDLYPIGCAGRITQFTETDEGNFLITLRGLSRFEITSTTLMDDDYYKAHIKWVDHPITSLEQQHYIPAHCRKKFKVLLDHYLAQEQLSINWDDATQLPESRFYTIVAMLAPLSPQEKQALLEAPDLATRCDMLYQLLEMAMADHDYPDDKTRSIH
jgi:Lon protease-like protein